MNRLLFYYIIVSIFVSGCSVNMTNGDNVLGKDNNTLPDNDKEKEEVIVDETKNLILNMSLDEKIGQLLITGLEYTEMSDRERNLIQSHKIGGFILFKRNIEDYEQTRELIDSLKRTNSNNKVSLFLSIDEEGGRVSRLNNIFNKMPPVSYLGVKNSKNLAFQYGQIQASKLLALGLNLNFSPVLDVNSNPENKVIGDRAISNNPEIVASLGMQISEAMMESSIIPVGKHYPGHGNTQEDSHYSLPIISKSKIELEEVELLPFKNAIDNGIPGLMIGHLYLEDLSDMPASLSSEIITEMLRKEQGFKGIVFSDDLTMGAISETYSIGEATVKFLIAGGDIALICHGEDNIYQVISSIKEALVKKQITESELDEKLYRIISVKNRFNLNKNATHAMDIEEINIRINKYLEQGE